MVLWIISHNLFLFAETKEFIEKLFKTLKDKSYIPGYTPPPPPPPPPPSDDSKQDSGTSQPSASASQDLVKENNNEGHQLPSQQQPVVVKEESRESIRKSNSNKVRGVLCKMYIMLWLAGLAQITVILTSASFAYLNSVTFKRSQFVGDSVAVWEDCFSFNLWTVQPHSQSLGVCGTWQYICRGTS